MLYFNLQSRTKKYELKKFVKHLANFFWSLIRIIREPKLICFLQVMIAKTFWPCINGILIKFQNRRAKEKVLFVIPFPQKYLFNNFPFSAPSFFSSFKKIDNFFSTIVSKFQGICNCITFIVPYRTSRVDQSWNKGDSEKLSELDQSLIRSLFTLDSVTP